MKNKHAKLIHAWIDGAEIERRGPIDKYPDADWEYDKYPCWFNDFEYRIKPEPMRELSEKEIIDLWRKFPNWGNEQHILMFAKELLKQVEVRNERN
jgi:hypothetical protein